MTLSQLASNSSDHLADETVLRFVPGNHQLDSILCVHKVSMLSMLPSESSFISNTINIACAHSKGFQLSHLDHVVIHDLHFTSCSNQIEYVSQVTIEDSWFFGEEKLNGTALELVETSAIIERCSFINNTIGSYRGPIEIFKMISDDDPSVPVSTRCGGAITVFKSAVTISASVFYGNNATVGGAIFSSSSNITIINCTLLRNTANSAVSSTSCHGGVLHYESDGYLEVNLTILNSEFVQNAACYGGAISVLFSNVDITNSLFQENSAIAGGVGQALRANLIIHDSTLAYNFALQMAGSIVIVNGSIGVDTTEFISNQGRVCGALYIYKCIVAILNSNFTNNTALEYGGVLGIHNNSNVSMQMNVFQHNSAKHAGVIYATEQCIVTILDNQFINNRVYGIAGVLWFYLSSVKVEANVFSKNMALTNCSSLSSSMSKVVIFNSQFVHNTAWENGGVLCSKTTTDLTINNCQFTDNQAKQGGVLFMENGSETAIFNTTFTKNLAQNGGVFAAYDHSNVTIMESDFSENQAQFGGAFILLSLSTLTAVNDTFSENTATIGGGVFFTNGFCNLYLNEVIFEMNNALQGGVWSAVRSNITVINSKFLENSANDTGVGSSVITSHVTIKGSHYINNTAYLAGALSGAYNTSVVIINSEFISNTAQIGGVFYMDSQASLDIMRGQFNYNYADNGSVLRLQVHSSVIINNSVLSNNRAFSKGAITGYENSAVIITESQLVNNVVERGTGGVMSLSNGSKVVIERSQLSNNRGSLGGVLYLHMNSAATIHACKMNNNTSHFGGVLAAMDNTTAIIADCTMSGNIASLGGVLSGVTNFTANLTMCEFINNTANQGGAVYLSQGKMHIKKSNFFDNQANNGGVVYVETESLLIIEDCVLASNVAIDEDIAIGEQDSLYKQLKLLYLDTQVGFVFGYGGVISTGKKSSLTIVGGAFVNNSAYHSGGAISTSGTTLDIRNCEFYGNSAASGSVIITSDSPSVDIHNCSFIGNTAPLVGGALMASRGILNISHSQFTYNSASFGVIYIASVEALLGGTIDFSYNKGSVYAYSSELKINGNIHFYQCLTLNLEENEGGAITAFQSILQLNGSLTFMNNYAKSGGALHLTESRINIGNGEATIQNNTAKFSGGGIYLYRSQLVCDENCTLDINGNEASEKGGGIHAVGSTISVLADYKETFLKLVKNLAKVGGGICFEVDSKLYIMKNVRKYPTEDLFKVSFTRNTAMYGGAIYIADNTYFKICESTIQNGKERSSIIHSKSTSVECFFQVLVITLGIIPNITSINIGFTENYASISGSDLYGGLLDRCTANPFTFLYYKANRTENVQNNLTISGVSYFRTISNTQSDKNSISSDPVRICFCQNGNPDCSYHVINKEVKKGETFSQSLVAVDQVNHTLSNIIIHSFLMFKESGIGEGQLSQKTGENCTSLNFTLFSPYSIEEVSLYAQGPCKDANLSRNKIIITFKNCTCPIGFQPKESESTDCVCECSRELLNCISNCNQHNATLVRNSSCWFKHSCNETCSTHYLIYRYCPYDYCYQPEERVEINLNVHNGADAQCANNRSGLLCGACQPGLSLSLGSSRCVSCPRSYTGLLAAYLLGLLLIGIILVSLLLCLNLTVAVGTLNGILFYANIVVVNNTLLTSMPNFISVFLLWLNFKVGIDVCLYEGMDSYWKTWLELTFPAYVIFLVVMVIILSERSMWFGRLIGKKNPVATLATLILLSYTTFLRSIIASFSLAILDYPDGSREIVWLPDANIKYLRGKHIPLFITAFLILLAGTAYTAILFSWQWLLHHQNKTVFKWVSNQKLCQFLEPYHAPYTFKHRYWTGLLLIIRAVLYLIISVVNWSNDPAVNLLATGSVMIGLLISKGMLGNNSRIYNKWQVELLEMMNYLNITLFSIAQLYVLKASIVISNIPGYLSGVFVFSLFICVLVYHGLTEVIFKINICKRLRSKCQRKEEYSYVMLNDFPPVNSEQSAPLLEPTFSIVEAPERGEVPLSALVNERKIEVTTESKDDMASTSSNDDGTSNSESSPLIIECTQ